MSQLSAIPISGSLHTASVYSSNWADLDPVRRLAQCALTGLPGVLFVYMKCSHIGPSLHSSLDLVITLITETQRCGQRTAAGSERRPDITRAAPRT